VCSTALQSYLETRNAKVERLPIDGYSDEEIFYAVLVLNWMLDVSINCIILMIDAFDEILW